MDNQPSAKELADKMLVDDSACDSLNENLRKASPEIKALLAALLIAASVPFLGCHPG